MEQGEESQDVSIMDYIEDYNWSIGVIERFYTKGTELYKILTEHSKKVADRAVQVLEAHPEIKADGSFIYRAAMLHDIGIIKTNAPSICCEGTEPYICHGYLGADMLRSIGLSEYAYVAERHTGTGLTREYIVEHGLPLPLDRTYMPESIEEKIVCYADKFYSKTKLYNCKDAAAVRVSLQKFGEDTIARFSEFDAMFTLLP